VARLSATAARPSFSRAKASPAARTNWSAYLYLLPSLVFLVAFSLWPAVESIYQSLFRINLLNPDRSFVGAGNYAALFDQALFWQVIGNTALFGLVTVPASVALALSFALLLNGKIALLGVWRTSIFYPTVLPMISGAAIWIFLYVPSYGLIDRVFALTGGNQVNWLSTGAHALPAVMVTTVWKQAGNYMIFFLAGLQGLSADVLEASQLDGATYLRTLRHIILPLLMPTTVFVTTIALVASVQAVDQVYLMTQGGPDNATNLVVYLLYQIAFANWDTGQAAALTVLLMLVLFGISWLNYRSLDRYTHYE
jgi:sn-glycerol 3-phosphate transport system permease protein